MPVTIDPVGSEQWPVVAWLWQAYRNDLSPVVGGFPRPDGRYNHTVLDGYPSEDGGGLLAWAPHPNTGEPAPVGFALVDGLCGARRSVAAFYVVPAGRRLGLGRCLALDLLSRYDGPWAIAFQHDNAAAGGFWRAVAGEAFGAAWHEEARAVPGKPHVPPDHWILTR